MTSALVDRAIDVLTSDDLEPIVEVVLRRDGDAYEAHAADGRVRFARDGALLDVDGRNPLDDQATDRFAGLAAERGALHPDRTANAYPFAYEQAAQVFDHPGAPDLCVIHTASHNWEDQGGHRGEHGSIDVVQARAPFILGGAGVAQLGTVERACRLVDVAPTIAALMGVAPLDEEAGRYLAVQDGTVLGDLLDGERPDHVVGFLFDGCNPNVLYDAAARGDAPNVARLMAMGTTFGHGAMASLPTVTLANHTSVLTGAHPGHHGILHNAWYDRQSATQIITNSPETWANAATYLAPGVETLHHAVHRTWAGAVTASINEPCDAGADFSTFGVIRAGGMVERPPAPEELPNATERFVRPVKEYRWSSRVDHTSVAQVQGVWGDGLYHGADWPLPRFCWVNFSLTDAAFHEGGPHSEIALASIHDTDARLGEVLGAIEAAGVWERTAFFLVADHGMEETNPAVRGDWGPVLRAEGIPYRDEAFGFLYVGWCVSCSAAMTCPKGEIEANVVAHEQLLEQGTRAGCDLVVLPEMSLTGYVNPAPETHHLALEDEPVRRLATATAVAPAVLFGIVERSPASRPFITQVLAADGRVVGVQRKRYLGEGEDDFAAATGDLLATVGGTTLGVAICAEGHRDEPFDDATAEGASLVAFCAAPGLHGRRTQEAEWRDGWTWWREKGVGDAQRHAKRCGIWVALSSQAGATVDEDFPGIAALISPDGDVVAETPDWHPATLIVDVARADAESRRSR